MNSQPIAVETTSKNVEHANHASWYFNSEKYQGSGAKPTGLRRIKASLERMTGLQITRREQQKFDHRERPHLREEHHQQYGGPWSKGREQMDFLLSQGLQTNDYFLDLGCGALRTGIWVIGYLEPAHYFGVDAHLNSLKAGAEYEIPLHDLESKSPRLLHSTTFEIDHFGATFDVVLAASVFDHLTEEQRRLALRKIIDHSSKRLRIFMYDRAFPFDVDALTREFGLVLQRKVPHVSDRFGGRTTWYVLERSDQEQPR